MVLGDSSTKIIKKVKCERKSMLFQLDKRAKMELLSNYKSKRRRRRYEIRVVRSLHFRDAVY